MTGPAFRSPGDLELAILDVLWGRGPSNARQVLEVLLESRELAYSTVLTVMRRMENKGMLSRRKVSRSHVYEPSLDRESFRSRSVNDFLSRVFGGSPRDLVAHLVDDEMISPKELAKIEALVRSRKKTRKKR